MKSLKTFKRSWIKATTIGFMSFILMIPISFIFIKLFHPPAFDDLTIAEIFQQTADKSPLEFGWTFYISILTGHFILYAIVATILGHLQYTILKEFIPNRTTWIIMTILGLEIILLFDLFYTGFATGGAPGPLEPLLIALGGGGLMAFMQFLYLRSTGIRNPKWVGWWIIGIFTGIISSFIFIMGYEYLFRDFIERNTSPMLFLTIDWLSFILPYFTLIGFFTGLFSARPIFLAVYGNLAIPNESN